MFFRPKPFATSLNNDVVEEIVCEVPVDVEDISSANTAAPPLKHIAVTSMAETALWAFLRELRLNDAIQFSPFKKVLLVMFDAGRRVPSIFP